MINNSRLLLPKRSFRFIQLSFLLSLFFGGAVLANQAIPDFSQALEEITFDPAATDGNLNESGLPNGILDSTEMGLITAILNNDSIDFEHKNGVSYTQIREAFDKIYLTVEQDMQPITKQFPGAPLAVTGYVMLGSPSQLAINVMTAHVGAPMVSDYSAYEWLSKLLGPQGDADGDGFSNIEEHNAFIDGGVDAYYSAALDPEINPSSSPNLTGKAEPREMKKVVGIVLYPGFEVLDVYGPVEMWSYVQEFKIITIAEKAGPVESAQGMSTIADYSFDDAPLLDIIMVPGGVGTQSQVENPAILSFLKVQHEQSELTTSVCTGSAILAKAGILDGHKATANKRFFYLSSNQSQNVDWVENARWVESGKVITSSGVSAGTDMALGLISKLYGVERAREIASGVEYEWHEDANDDPFSGFVRR